MPFFAKRKRNGNGNSNGNGYKAKRPRMSTQARATTAAAFSGSELKFFDGTTASAVVSDGGAIKNVSLNLIQQGIDENDRIGRKCVVESLYMHGQLKLPAQSGGAGGTGDRVRVIVYVDKQANGATATVTGILEAADIQSFRNLANSGRFRMLKDQNYTLNVPAGAGDGAANDFAERITEFSCSVPRLMLPLEFDAAAGVITELRSNNIGVLVISEAGVATLQYGWRLRFRG